MGARQYPEELWSMVIDGSDTSEWGFPHPAVKTNESKRGKKLQCKVHGVIVHVHFAACYVLNSHLPGAPTSLLKETTGARERFPCRLIIQFDNTSTDNKRRFVISYFYLLGCGYFNEITVFFFEVGHTHCNNDQLFTHSSIWKTRTFGTLTFYVIFC